MGPVKGNSDDLTTLGELDENSLLEELQERYRRDKIYTYIGDILLSVNPYKIVAVLYGEEVGLRYGRAKSFSDLQPHVYALASRAYHSVQRQEGNQTVLVSGESGAGKTEITKMMVAQIARLSQWTGEYFLQERIIEVNPLLEAFGNACTVMNHNSSRFGKLIEMIFSDSGSLLGAVITEHMLEKSRVAQQSQGERNFHIFYNMMCGLTLEERKRYFLEQPERYRIIDPGHGAPVIASKVDWAGHKEGMDNLRRIMPIVGFNNQDMDVVFALLAAILHLCNIELAVEPESDEVIVMNEEEIGYASTLLSVQAEDFITVLLSNVNWVRGERIMYIKTLNQAVDGRDALAKALYSKLFSWIILQINFMLHEDESKEGERCKIGILDMAGFENFKANSFEQLCINAANERLQNYFNEHIFALELQEYLAEGIKSPKVKFSNNVDVLNMFFQRPMGLFLLLEEECVLARSTDMTFVDKLTKHMAKHENFKKSKHREPIFAVLHYAGLVTYNAVGFLEKNRDTLSTNMQSLMENSKNNLVNELFLAKVLDTGTLNLRHGSDRSRWQTPTFDQPEMRNYAPGDSLSRQAGRKIRQKMKEQQSFADIPLSSNPNSASAHFKNSLQSLVNSLKGSTPQFIRCIKPNHQKLPNVFDRKLVTEQLRSTGVLEMIKIRKLGYAVRLPFHVFLQRYKFLAFPLSVQIEPSARNCSLVLKKAKLNDVQIGTSKVFLKYWQVEQLSAALDRHQTGIVRIQARTRSLLARRRFLYESRMMQQDAEEVMLLGNYISNQGRDIIKVMVQQNDHDVARAVRVPPSPQSNGYYTNEREADRMPDVFSPGNPTHGGHKNLYKHVVQQVLDKLGELDTDVWCKLFYMEYDKPVAKFYLCDREVLIDGSYDEFDGKKVGLGVFKNSERNEITEKIRGYIGKGIKVHKEMDGSITATRLGKNEVVVKGYQDPANHCLPGELVVREGQLPLEQPVKVFDMDEYKSHIGLALRSGTFSLEKLQLLSVTGIAFIEDQPEGYQTPCWLCIVNNVALEALSNPDVKKEVQQRFVQLSLNKNGKEGEQQVLQDIAERHNRNWSKLNLRQTSQAKEPLRKSRIQIKQQGQKIQDRMDYSWQEEVTSPQMNMSELEEYDQYDEVESVMPSPNTTPGRMNSMASSMAYNSRRSDSPGETPARRKNWAKIHVTMKQEQTLEGEKLQKSRAMPKD